MSLRATAIIGALILNGACHQSSDTGSSLVKSGYNGISCSVDQQSIHNENLHGISIRDLGIGESEKRRHLNELNSMPRAFLDTMRNGISINLTAGTITEFPEYEHLKEVTPRGWEGTGWTWDDVPGAGDWGALYLGDSYRPNDARSLAIHEATHSVDQARSLTSLPELIWRYEAERQTPHPDDQSRTYRMGYIEEYLAMAVEEFYCSPETNSRLKLMYPKAHEFVADKLNPMLQQGLNQGGDTFGASGYAYCPSAYFGDVFDCNGRQCAKSDPAYMNICEIR